MEPIDRRRFLGSAAGAAAALGATGGLRRDISCGSAIRWRDCDRIGRLRRR